MWVSPALAGVDWSLGGQGLSASEFLLALVPPPNHLHSLLLFGQPLCSALSPFFLALSLILLPALGQCLCPRSKAGVSSRARLRLLAVPHCLGDAGTGCRCFVWCWSGPHGRCTFLYVTVEVWKDGCRKDGLYGCDN